MAGTSAGTGESPRAGTTRGAVPHPRVCPMTAVSTRLGAALGIGPRPAVALVVCGLMGLALAVAFTTRLGLLPMAVVLAVGGVGALVALRWPLLGLLALALLIPVEEVAIITGFGTLSRFAGLAFAVTYAIPRLATLRLGVIPLAGWAFIGWAVLSTAWAISPATAWTELPTLLQMFVIALLIGDFVTRDPSIVRPVLVAYSVSAAAMSVISIVSYVAGAGLDVRAAALEGQNPAQFAAVLLPAFAFGFNEVVNGKRRVAGGLIALLTLVGVVVSGTRGAWVAVAVIPLFILPNLSPKRIAASLAVGAALLLVTYQIPGVSELVSDRAATALSTGGAGRTDIWSTGLVIYSSSPALGVGYANFPVAYTPEVIRLAGVTSYTYAGRGPHNLVVGTLAELGPLGLLLLTLFVLPLAINRGWGPDASTVRAALASLLTTALFLDILGNRKQVWLVIGLTAGLVYLARKTREPATPALTGGGPAS